MRLYVGHRPCPRGANCLRESQVVKEQPPANGESQRKKLNVPRQPQGRNPGQENPRGHYRTALLGRTPETRARQLRDEAKSCGTQPANIRVIYRRHMGSAPLGALEHNHDKDHWIKVGRIYFFLLTTVNHISVHPEMVDFGSGQGRSDFATAGVVRLRRGLQRARTPAGAERCRLWMD